jgi:hypothetical protein
MSTDREVKMADLLADFIHAVNHGYAYTLEGSDLVKEASQLILVVRAEDTTWEQV